MTKVTFKGVEYKKVNWKGAFFYLTHVPETNTLWDNPSAEEYDNLMSRLEGAHNLIAEVEVYYPDADYTPELVVLCLNGEPTFTAKPRNPKYETNYHLTMSDEHIITLAYERERKLLALIS